jgi:hypothetical protein
MMHDLERIERALASNRLDAELVERLAQDQLSAVFPGLSPIPGGTDSGRDADIHSGVGQVTRLLVTSARTPDGVRKNLRKNMKSMKEHGVQVERLVLCNPAQLNETQRNKLRKIARDEGSCVVEAIYDRTALASWLRRDGEWRERLLGLSGEPISLSRMPADLAESPWAQLPVIGRDEIISEVESREDDLILTGPPGVGKSRVLTAIQEAVFVDKDAPIGRIADDLRWLRPRHVIVDDAATAAPILRELIRLRQTEPDLVSYRIIAVCWPDDAPALTDVLAGAGMIELELLERQHLDAVLIEMGVTSQLARGEILDQAEGRPGWAVSLADTLIKSTDPSSLLNGRALLGEAERYLRRASVAPEAIDVLATIASLRSVSQPELDRVAAFLQMSKPAVVGILERAARSGLVDVQSPYDWEKREHIRCFSVRPPMLADALATERAFLADIAGIDLQDLAADWPDKLVSLTKTAIRAVRLGAQLARNLADDFVARTLAADVTSYEENIQMLQDFAQLDAEASDDVLRIARHAFDELGEGRSPHQIEGIVQLAFLIAAWRNHSDAVILLLDAALDDHRETHPHPGHPLRKLSDLVHEFHPEIPHDREHRDLLAQVSVDWVADSPDSRHWRVFGKVVRTILSLDLHSTLTTPADRLKVQLIHTTVTPSEIERIYKEVWPIIAPALKDAPGETISEVVRGVEGWLRVGADYDRPFGQAHSEEVMKAAREMGEDLFNQVAKLASGNRGVQHSIREISERFSIPIDQPVDDSYSAFFTDFERRPDWQAGIKELQEGISAAVSGWAEESPTTVVPRLASLRNDLDLANLRWPDRIQMAFSAMADRIESPGEWIDIAQTHDLFPEATPLLGPAWEKGELTTERLIELLGSRGRWSAISVMLTRGEDSPELDLVVSNLTPAEFELFKTMVIREELSAVLTSRLLNHPNGATRGAFAAAMLIEAREVGEDWTPKEHESEWQEAIKEFDPTQTPSFADYEAGQLMAFLAHRYPAAATEWIMNRFRATLPTGGVFNALPHGCWEQMHRLPPKQKDELWNSFADEPSARWILGRQLVGNDAGSLGQAIANGLMSVEDALGYYDGLGAQPSIEEMAQLLVPHGVEPQRIASLAHAGTWVGEHSDRYRKLKEDFEQMAKSGDESVKLVGEAGAALFEEEMNAALQKEKIKRIRGEL